MKHSNPLIIKSSFVIIFLLCFSPFSKAQEVSGTNSSNNYHNQLFFNRYLINPTFSLVRENKSYLNILHRNQYSTFEDNSQNYFLGFSNLINEKTALGIGVYSQWSGVVQQFGFNANYATAVQLGAKSKLTFGTNITYYNEGVDKNRIVATQNDGQINNAKKESKLAIQPGMALSIGKFDIGIYATDLLKYNQSSNEFSTNLNTKTLQTSLQYTHTFNAGRGLFKDARLLPLVQIGQNADNSFNYMGSFLLDMPSYGWIQSTYDAAHGISAGVGFNLSKKMSLGYLLEKNVVTEEANLGWNHELSLAYTFKDNTAYGGAFTENSNDQKIDGIIRNYEEQILQLIADKNEMLAENQAIQKNNSFQEQKTIKVKKTDTIKKNTLQETTIKDLAYENRQLLDALILRQDSIEAARNADLEKRFKTLARLVKSEIKRNSTPTPTNITKKSNSNLASVKSTTVKETKPIAVKTERAFANHETKGYVKLPIKVLDQDNIVGVKSGYYVIANVYKTKKYLDAFIHTLKDQGLNAKQFYNKENGLYYVYLADYNYKKDAETAFVSNLNGKYNDEKWIMQVDNRMATVSNTYND
ncbi:type IX secretion system membrane protein PorP/SprF [uncultured Maribacter sp.]|uniref:PorP/SprF family type IX secretion system membrane protein n=1 Tax=uncultured Maribacter sp. TaxID=431308 RepID=UPI002615129B|nr:type IX secretion system membrane protein PorP/SprF [uncultured Maribacter sp.]